MTTDFLRARQVLTISIPIVLLFPSRSTRRKIKKKKFSITNSQRHLSHLCSTAEKFVLFCFVEEVNHNIKYFPFPSLYLFLGCGVKKETDIKTVLLLDLKVQTKCNPPFVLHVSTSNFNTIKNKISNKTYYGI